MEKLFYRVGTDTKEGLWYDKDGKFTGLIHDKFKWCFASALQMPFEDGKLIKEVTLDEIRKRLTL